MMTATERLEVWSKALQACMARGGASPKWAQIAYDAIPHLTREAVERGRFCLPYPYDSEEGTRVVMIPEGIIAARWPEAHRDLWFGEVVGEPHPVPDDLAPAERWLLEAEGHEPVEAFAR